MAESPPFWARHLYRRVQFALDLAVLVASFALAYLLRFDFAIPRDELEHGFVQLPYVVLIQFAVVLFSGIYRFVWRYVGLAELAAFLRAAALSALPVVVLRLTLPNPSYAHWRVPLSIIVLDTVFAFGGLLAVRILRRVLYERYERDRRAGAEDRGRPKPVLLVGAGRAGVQVVREIRGRGDMDLDVVGFVDDDPLKRGTVIQGVEVLGSCDEIPLLCRRYPVESAIIAIAESSAESIRRIVAICERARVKVQIIPGLYEILDGRVSIGRFRDIQIEDLLGREPVRLDEDEVERFLSGKRVMLTGAGGSIGAELVRQCARFAPDRLLLVERTENSLFELDREIADLWPGLDVVPLLADVGDEERMRALLAAHRPEIVFHAAAHKHVPMMERNPAEAIKNNVLATHLLGRLAGELGTESFVLVSTDKAVRPTSVMGASKRIAELVVQDLDRRFLATRFMAVRFGNVLGSAGSVIPIFRRQIERGGPVTVTHPEAMRYFMTIPEAAQLVLEAGALGRGGEILILDMGTPVKIVDLARDMIRLSGLSPDREIEIRFVGLRPGEKLREELGHSEERLSRTRHPKILVGRLEALSSHAMAAALTRLAELARRQEEGPLRAFLGELLPDAQLGGEPVAEAAPPETVGSGA